MRAQGEALKRQLSSPVSERQPVTREQLEKEDKQAAARERIAAVIGAQPTEQEITEVIMPLDEAMHLRGLGLKIHVGSYSGTGKVEGKVVYAENPQLALAAAPTDHLKKEEQ